MPHFIIDCSEQVLSLKSPEEIIQAVSNTAVSTNLFATSGAGRVRVRINPYRHHNPINSNDDFIHVFANILEGRTADQKKDLSKKVVTVLKGLFPEVPLISMNVYEFEKSSYCNSSMI